MPANNPLHSTHHTCRHRNTMISSWTKQPKMYGFALPTMDLAILLKDSLTNVLTIFFIPIDRVPPDNRPTHACFVCSYHPQKAKPHCTCLNVGSNLIDYPGNLSMKVANMTTFKSLVNSTLSTPGACWLGNRILTWLTANPPGVWPQNTPTRWV